MIQSLSLYNKEKGKRIIRLPFYIYDGLESFVLRHNDCVGGV